LSYGRQVTGLCREISRNVDASSLSGHLVSLPMELPRQRRSPGAAATSATATTGTAATETGAR